MERSPLLLDCGIVLTDLIKGQSGPDSGIRVAGLRGSSRASTVRRGISGESFNGKLRDEFFNGEILYTLREAQILTGSWRRLYNGLRPHSSLGQRPPAPEALAFPGFSLADYDHPSLTREVALGLT